MCAYVCTGVCMLCVHRCVCVCVCLYVCAQDVCVCACTHYIHLKAHVSSISHTQKLLSFQRCVQSHTQRTNNVIKLTFSLKLKIIIGSQLSYCVCVALVGVRACGKCQETFQVKMTRDHFISIISRV